MLKETNVEDREVHTALKSPTGIDEKTALVTVNATAKDVDQTQLFEHLNAANAAEGKDIIRFIRGADVEGFRDRGGHRLGDIIHSSPVVVGAPQGYFNASDYVGFRREHATRKRMLYVGANDGMLHAFYLDGPEGGKEAWAFIPNNLLGKLRDLTSPDYDDCHEFFVDSTPIVTDVFIDPDGAGPESQQWRTLLIGGERQGGSAYFALDITNPAPDQFKPLWQFSDKRLGESWSRPAVERVRAGDRDKWLGFVGSGFNRDETGDGRGYLFAIDLESGGHFGDPIPLEGDAGNVLTSPRGVDINGDDYADALFAGDHTGELWRFNITDQTGAAKTYEPIDPVDWECQKLFRTLPDQPITLPVGLSFYCASPADKTCQNLFVYFGTGKFLTTDDKTDFSIQSFYAIKAERSEGSAMTRDDLVNRTTNACEEVPDPSKINGWYVDLEAPGERVSSPPLVMRGLVFFLTFVPEEDPCSAGGTTWLYYREFDTGCIPDEPIFAGGPGGGGGDGQRGRPVGKVLIGPGYAPDLVYHARTQDMLIQTSDRAIHAKKLNPPQGSIMNYAWREVFF
jgi:type IV pilus assembly protein PilY1